MDHPALALSLRYLAGTLGDLGLLERSAELKERALGIAQRNFGANHHVTGEYLHSLGLAELDRGAYTTARGRLVQALRIYEARYGRWHEHVATALSVLAIADAKLGDYSSARREQSRAASIHTRIGGPNHPFVATALTELAAVYRQQGSARLALRPLERALAIREMQLGRGHPDVARTLVDLASVLQQLDRPARAHALARRALDIWDRTGAPDAREFAAGLALYGELQIERGRYEAAKSAYQRAMQIRARTLGVSHPAYAEAESGLALALANLGDTPSAFRAATNAEATGREHLGLMLRSLPERQALNYAAARPRAESLMLSLASALDGAVPQALDSVIRSRALVLDEIATRQGAARGQDAPVDALWIAFTSAQQRLANLLVRGQGQVAAAQYQAIVDQARHNSELAEQRLAERSVTFTLERSRAQIGLSDVQESLRASDMLVSFVRYDRWPVWQARSVGSRTATGTLRTVPSYMAFVVRTSTPPLAIPLGSARTIDALVAEWRHALVAEVGAAATTTMRTSHSTGIALRKLIWDPITPHLHNIDRVFIVPDGSLSLVPFVALPVARSYLVESGPVIHYLSAERDAARPPATTGGNREGLLAVGGPAFDASVAIPATVTSRGGALVVRGDPLCSGLGTFEPLAGTLQEVKELAAAWSQGRRDATANATLLLTGRAATEGKFKQEAARYGVLHLATHGFFLGGQCAPGVRTTRSVGGLSAAKPGQPRAAHNPLHISGLAFAGANRRSSAGQDEDDGILTAEEVASLEPAGHGMGRAVGVRYGTRSNQSRRRGVRPAPRLPDRGRAHGDHEPLVGRRSGHPPVDARAV